MKASIRLPRSLSRSGVAASDIGWSAARKTTTAIIIAKVASASPTITKHAVDRRGPVWLERHHPVDRRKCARPETARRAPAR